MTRHSTPSAGQNGEFDQPRPKARPPRGRKHGLRGLDKPSPAAMAVPRLAGFQFLDVTPGPLTECRLRNGMILPAERTRESVLLALFQFRCRVVEVCIDPIAAHAGALGIDPRTANRWLALLLDYGLLRREGTGVAVQRLHVQLRADALRERGLRPIRVTAELARRRDIGWGPKLLLSKLEDLSRRGTALAADRLARDVGLSPNLTRAYLRRLDRRTPDAFARPAP